MPSDEPNPAEMAKNLKRQCSDTAKERCRTVVEDHIEPIGYRMPFGFVGVRGAAAGTAICALDKTKVILRLEASVRRGDGGVALEAKGVERFDITEHILSSTDGDGAAAAA